MSTLCGKSIYTFMFTKDLRFDLKDLGLQNKWKNRDLIFG